VTCDEKIHTIAHARLEAGETFRMVFWPQEHHARMSDGDLLLLGSVCAPRSAAASLLSSREPGPAPLDGALVGDLAALEELPADAPADFTTVRETMARRAA
jgi:hypothetical protein